MEPFDSGYPPWTEQDEDEDEDFESLYWDGCCECCPCAYDCDCGCHEGNEESE